MSETIILKVGGSILSKSEEKIFDFETAEKIKNLLVPFTEGEYKFILCCGGGYLARKYQDIVKQSGGTDRDMHWIGTEACNMNAVAMKVALGELAEDKPVLSQSIILPEPIIMTKDFLTVGAAEPGHSSDMDSVEIAIRAKANSILSLKNIDGVYSDDPRKNPEAKKYTNLSWEEYFGIIKTDIHIPGGHFPVDPIAAKKASENKISFIILDGENMENLAKAIKKESFVGTIIS